ncbi:uncharacterized protein V1510DRAFT_416602 [Dipodascopsis tothii]|uniref:uncharacterized protein n=1 Tax=Dipodascopsis tothii TaxID=44089 RepID=UPI0034D00BF3
MAALRLSVAAGSAYGGPTQPVAVNTERAAVVRTPAAECRLVVRIRDYTGLPDGSPQTCAYFADAHAGDRLSIGFDVTFAADVGFDDLVFGNDFDRPVRDSLPYGFGVAFGIFNRLIDPSATGDLYADKPYLYGYAVTSVNTIAVGAAGDGPVGAEAEGLGASLGDGVPATPAERRKYFLDATHRQGHVFRAGQTYRFDFFNPYLDMSELVLRLPGYSLGVAKYWDGQPLRYVLKQQSTDTVLFTVLFQLEDAGAAGPAGPEAAGAADADPPTADPAARVSPDPPAADPARVGPDPSAADLDVDEPAID